MVTDSAFYDNTDKLKSYGVYDSGNTYWRLYKLYPGGKIEQTQKLNPVTFLDKDSSVVYHPNGNIAWIFPYTDSGFLTGRLTGYYENGSIKRESHYYRTFQNRNVERLLFKRPNKINLLLSNFQRRFCISPQINIRGLSEGFCRNRIIFVG